MATIKQYEQAKAFCKKAFGDSDPEMINEVAENLANVMFIANFSYAALELIADGMANCYICGYEDGSANMEDYCARLR